MTWLTHGKGFRPFSRSNDKSENNKHFIIISNIYANLMRKFHPFNDLPTPQL